ncbi:MAG TPA: 4Fe-4S dicluster domain-containing protein, partial [Terriglobales bacterium]|nr:4Fe-4S dicluster domain-containing protein [Terriglobales bacterium]
VPNSPAPCPVHCGELIDITGRLGDFHVIIEEASGEGKARREILADQVVVLGQNGGRAFKSRTGCYRLVNPSEEDLEKLAERLQDHTGEFLKPVHVTYASDGCAGGSAGQESCGICIDACPYGAIGRDARNHLRVQVHHMACEGCGACVSVCPTSALEFATPSPRALYARLAALLRPAGNGKEESPKAVVFHCGEEGQRVLLDAGREGAGYPASVIPVEMACLRHVSEANMLAAFHMGAAGVVLLGCDSCVHGERELLYQKMDFGRVTLEAFGLGSERLRLITVERGEARQALQALSAFAENLKPSPMVWNGRLMRDMDNRGVITEAVASLIEQTGREPGRILLDASQPFAFADVKDSGCTLCRSCVNACPVHAFRLEESTQSLQFKAIACVACGLCETVCPEHVITLRREIYLEKDALQYQTMVQDPMVPCAKCGKAYINRKALETVEARLFSLESLLDTFAGNRKNLLRMCPDCRAVDAMLEVEKGWKP